MINHQIIYKFNYNGDFSDVTYLHLDNDNGI